MIRKLLRYVLALFALFMLYVAVVLVQGTMGDWQPEAELPVQTFQTADSSVIADSVIRLAIWNIGYGGLGEESDFFYDGGGFFLSGGHDIRPEQSLVEKNVAGVSLFTRSTEADFFLFQEVDIASRRSYFTQQVDTIRSQRPGYAASFAPNYKVARMPLPILEPWRAYGQVTSGVATVGKWQPYSEKRLQLPGSFEWPTRIFNLDRCLLVGRYKTASGKDLVLVNAHLSAYDKGGELKKQEMAFIRDLVQAEYAQGHYVIVGADWNQCPPFFPFDSLAPSNDDNHTQTNIPPDFLPDGWQWLYDPVTPTNRKVRRPYDPETTFRTVIDFFLVSPNIQAIKIKAIDQQFRFSDHQPVWVELALR